jgi:8-oxo-dGTP pyrophosphatase MutT (NUDIX family)
MPQHNQKRKTFYLDNDNEKPLRAGGVIIYRKTKEGKIELLLINSETRKKYEDIGGSTDEKDENIKMTIAREVEEETNKVISYGSMYRRLCENPPFIYSKNSKYIVYIIKASPTEEKLESELFGNREIHDDIPRVIDWLPLSTFLHKDTIAKEINYRLKNYNLFKKLESLEKPTKKKSSRIKKRII